MKRDDNRGILFVLGFVFVFFFIISCSDSNLHEEQKVSDTKIKKEIVKTTNNSISKTTCTDCHCVNDKGDLKFRNKDGKFELKQKASD